MSVRQIGIFGSFMTRDVILYLEDIVESIGAIREYTAGMTKPLKGVLDMTKVEELEMEVDSLSQEEYSRFRRWFLNRDWEKWDQEIEEDSNAGRLDFLVREAAQAKDKNNLRRCR